VVELQRGEGGTFRQPSWLERAGARLARWVPGGALRSGLRSLYRGVLGLASGRRGISALLPGGERVLMLPAYRHMAWNAVEYAAFREAARPGGVALDVGANVGAYALALGFWLRPGGRVYAFEPAPDSFRGLAAHVRLNGLEGTVVPVQAAAAGFTGSARLQVDGVSGENRLGPEGQGEAVQAITLDDFCAREGINPAFIKVDVEGFELEVLKGARHTIRAAGAGLALFLEIHPSLWPGLGISRADLEAELALQGLRPEPLREVADPWALEGECLRLLPLASAP
jgi:FkbM family methyltransferase